MSTESLYIVALGASAGGHQALWEFFSHIPARSDLAFVIIQHLTRDMISIADQLLGKYTALPISWAADGQRVRAKQIYMLPPGKYMTLESGKLHVFDRDPDNLYNAAIDIFFKSLAQDKDGHSIGIVLSGAGSDGTNGALDLYQNGGIVMVQDPASAAFSSMPANAILKDHVQCILPPKELAQAVLRFIDEPAKGSTNPCESKKSGNT